MSQQDGRTLQGLGLSDVRTVYQPVVDLRDGHVVGYEALVRGGPDNELRSPAELFAHARAADVVAEFDAALREAAVRGFELNGSGPFALFLNAAAETLGDAAERIPSTRQTVVIEIPERALIANPDSLLQALTRFRVHGWGVAIDDVGADSRSLALMPLLYPDVIKLDLRRLSERDPADVARIVGAVGAESERRQALVLAEGIDSEEQLAAARAFGATLGQGYLLGEPAPLPGQLPEPGRKLRLTDSGGDVAGEPPFRRVTNWKRPAVGTRELAEATAQLIMRQALALGETAVRARLVPGRGPRARGAGRRAARARGLAGVRGRPVRAARARRRRRAHRAARGRRSAARDVDRDRAGARPRRLLRRLRVGGRDVPARHLLRPRPGRGVGAADHGPAAPARSASSLITFESWPPCQASGELPGSSERSSASGIASA